MSIERGTLDYNVGALIILAISVGLAVAVYGAKILYFDVFVIPAWIFGPLSVYTIVFSFLAGKESTYYLVWGVIMFAIATASAFYNTLDVFIVLGILLITIAVIAIVAYLRGKE